MALRLKDVKGLKGVDLKGVERRGRYRVAPKSERTMDGIVFDSASEMRRYATLKLGQRGGMLSDLRLQPSYRVDIEGEHFCTYTADFAYTEQPSGALVIEEVESIATGRDPARKLRRKAAELKYGFTVRKFVAR